MKTLYFSFPIIIFMLFAGWLQAQTTVGPFTFTPTNSGGTMQGQAQINGVPGAAGDIVAAFRPCGMCVGAAPLIIHQGVGYINFVIYGDDGTGNNNGMLPGELFNLKLYDASEDIIIEYGQGLSGWSNTNFAPMQGFNNPNQVYNFQFSTSVLTLVANPEEGGELTGAGTYLIGQSVDINAIANVDWEFINWTDMDGNVVFEEANNTIEMPAGHLTLIANFEYVQEILPFLNVTPLIRNVTSSQGTTTFSISSNTTWTVSQTVPWLSVSPTGGSNNATLNVTYNENTGEARSGIITVSAEDVPSVTVAVNQDAAVPFLTVNPETINIGPAAGNTSFNISSNTAWNITHEIPWINISPLAGSNNENISIVFEANNSGANRSGTITVSATGVLAATVEIMQAATQEQVLVSMPNMSALPGATVEIPVNVSELSDYEIISVQFTVGFDATVLVPAAPYIITSGTLTGDAGWTVMGNPNNPGQIIVGGFGQYALTGAGELIKLVFNVVGEMGDQSDLVFENFLFNAGFPAVDLVDAVFTIPVKVCGDTDENGFVQAYDAALTLQHSIGLITLPPQGALNADVNEDGMVTAFDAALILRHAIGITMPDGENTCFDNIVTYGFFNWDDLTFDAHLLKLSRQNHQTAATIGFSGIDKPETVYSVMMDVHSASGNIAGFEPVGLPAGYIHYTKRINSHAYRLAVINPYGIFTDDLNLEVLIGDDETDVSISISSIILNDRMFDDILLNASLSEFNMSVYPNPFSLSATVSYDLPGDSHVEIRILDFYGRHINTLFSGMQAAGTYDVAWHGDNQGGYRLPSGWYLVQIKTENHLEQTKLILY